MAHRDAAAAKRDLRTTMSEARSRLSQAQLRQSRLAVCAAVVARFEADRAAGRGWRSVFAYEPLATEPGSDELLEALREGGCTVHVPVLRIDRDLDWKVRSTPDLLGTAAIAGADAVLVPALAVDRFGGRLGRGGGSYDRVLPRVQTTAVVVALLHRGELIERVPTESWDRRVRAVAGPDGWADLASAGD